jgi:precorrin-2 dehydrogenase
VSSGWSTLPVELYVRGRRAVVIGQGAECATKVSRLLDAGALVRVITGGGSIESDISSAIGDRTEAVEIFERAFLPHDVDGACAVFVSAALESLGADLSRDAWATGRLVCTLDRPESSTFINPAMIRDGGLSITISSGGAAPALVKRLREDVARLIARTDLTAFLGEVSARREKLPRGERGSAAARLVEGFRIDFRVTFPDWFGGTPGSRAPRR